MGSQRGDSTAGGNGTRCGDPSGGALAPATASPACPGSCQFQAAEVPVSKPLLILAINPPQLSCFTLPVLTSAVCQHRSVTDTGWLCMSMPRSRHLLLITTFISSNKYYQLGTGHSHTQTHAHFTDINSRAQSATSAWLSLVNELPNLALKLFLAVPIC